MKLMELLHVPLFVFAFALLPLTVVAQPADGVIKGRVTTENGQPIPHAIISILGVGERGTQLPFARNTVGDDDGNFLADGLPAIPYLISAWAPGYVPTPDGATLNPFEVSKPHFVQVGETLTIKLTRGGVITGRVTNDAGPVIGVPVKTIRIKDEYGRSITVDAGYAHLWTRTTDDRGVYRIYGLAPGSYIIAAGGRDISSDQAKPFAGRMTTYYPSATREAAMVVNVASGLEASGIDIRYRGETGFVVSGKIYEATPGTGTSKTSSQVFLRSLTTGETVDTTNSEANNNQGVYAFYGVPSGEYEVVAINNGSDGENGLTSTSRRIAIKDADVTEFDLILVPNASVSGVVVRDKRELPECETQRKFEPSQIIVRARRDDTSGKTELLLRGGLEYGVGTPYEKGAFTIRNLKPGRHHIELELPDETWYLKTLAMTGSKPSIDPRVGVTVKAGENLTGLSVMIARGAAILKGKITVVANTKLATRLHVYLIPAEVEAIDDILRFVETGAEADGSFSFSHLAPGKYFILARSIPKSEAANHQLRPAAWGPAERKNLRKDAEASNIVIDLKPCKQVTDYALTFTNSR